MLHSIQTQILVLLMKSDSSKRYAQLMIPGIENDLFNYHLQQLVKTGYIQKLEIGYQLTQNGMQYVSQLDIEGNPRKYFKSSVALVVFRNNKTELLMQERLRNPFIGDTTTIAGKILYGEKVIDAAKRKLLEEAGLVADFSLAGILRKIRRNNDNEVIEDSLYHYCIASEPSGELVQQNEHGKNFWTNISNALKFEENNIDAGEYDLQIIKDITAGKTELFYYEQDVIISKY